MRGSAGSTTQRWPCGCLMRLRVAADSRTSGSGGRCGYGKGWASGSGGDGTEREAVRQRLCAGVGAGRVRGG